MGELVNRVHEEGGGMVEGGCDRVGGCRRRGRQRQTGDLARARQNRCSGGCFTAHGEVDGMKSELTGGL